MDRVMQSRVAASFRALHGGSSVLVLPNAWDAASARVFEEAGLPAVGTTSAGVAWSLGSPDGEVLPRENLIEAVARICRAVSVPVSADIESGYAENAGGVADTVAAVLEVGAVGVNLEDGTGRGGEPLRPMDEQLARIDAARSAASDAGMDVVLNARTDVYWARVGDAQDRFALAVARARAYRDAGADCVFVPGAADLDTIATLVREIDAPLNVLAGPGVPEVDALRRVGVARVSVGSGPVRAALGLTQRIASELLRSGTYDSFVTAAMPYPEANRLLVGAAGGKR